MFELDEEQVQQTPQQAQSPDDIEDGEQFIHKLKKMEDFGNFLKEATKLAMLAQLQLCHENSANLAGHMMELGKTLEPAQFTYIMKHSLRPLVELSIPQVCAPLPNLNLTSSASHLQRQKKRGQLT